MSHIFASSLIFIFLTTPATLEKSKEESEKKASSSFETKELDGSGKNAALEVKTFVLEKEFDLLKEKVSSYDSWYSNFHTTLSSFITILSIVISCLALGLGIGFFQHNRLINEAVKSIKCDFEMLKVENEKLNSETLALHADFKDRSDGLHEGVIRLFGDLTSSLVQILADQDSEVLEKINSCRDVSLARMQILSHNEAEVFAGLDKLYVHKEQSTDSWHEALMECRKSWPSNPDIITRIDEILDYKV